MDSNIYIPQTAYLKNIVRSVWQTEGAPGFKTESIIPKGVIEIIFDLSDSPAIQAMFGDEKHELPQCFINGFNTFPIQLQLPKKHSYLGVQFHPAAIKKIFGIPAYEFCNCSIDLELINSSLLSVLHQLAEKSSFAERINIISMWLHNKPVNIDPQEKLLDNFLASLDAEPLPVDQLAKTICYSPRHLSRKIYDLTGMNTEDIILYKKYLHSIHLIHSTNLSLTEIAYESHFTDQSHFIRSFRAYTQMTPGEYRKLKSPVAGHFFENVR